MLERGEGARGQGEMRVSSKGEGRRRSFFWGGEKDTQTIFILSYLSYLLWVIRESDVF